MIVKEITKRADNYLKKIEMDAKNKRSKERREGLEKSSYAGSAPAHAPPPKDSFFSWFGYLSKNLAAKAISLILALFLYAYVQYTATVTRSVQVPLIQPELPSHLVFSRKIPSFLNVKFYGRREQMDFDISNFTIKLENPHPLPGLNLYIAKIDPDPPIGIQLSYKKELQILVDRSFMRELSVIPKLQVELPREYELGYVSISPPTVLLKGPYESLSSMSHVESVELRVEDTHELLSYQVRIDELPDFVSFAPKQPFQVELSINILPKKAKQNYQSIPNVPIRCSNKLPGIKMRLPGKTAVDIYVNETAQTEALKRLRALVFCPVFFDSDSKTLRPSFLIQNQPVFVVDPFGSEDAQVVKVEPATVSLQFEWQGKPQKEQEESK